MQDDEKAILKYQKCKKSKNEQWERVVQYFLKKANIVKNSRIAVDNYRNAH